MDTDRIERRILLNAPRARVWRALADAGEFGSWFGIAFQGQALQAGGHVRGRVTYPGYEHIVFEIWIEKMEPERLLTWRWHPAPIEKGVDYSAEPTTLVVFELQDSQGGTLLTVTESGFDALPAARRAEAFRMNSQGWDGQMENIRNHVAKT